MNKRRFFSLAWLAAIWATLSTAQSQVPPSSGLYQIDSGTYYEEGGFVAINTLSLPSPSQALISLLVDAQTGAAEMTFLDQDLRPVFPQLTNGVVSGSTIRFQSETVNPYYPTPAMADYTVTNAAGYLWIGGSITSAVVCCDIPYAFGHRNVRATSGPAVAIRVSEIEVCWSSASNLTYQVQYRSEMTTNLWTDLGAPVHGNGTTNCLPDKVSPGQPQKFYRVVLQP
jgi:hypothetical protein